MLLILSVFVLIDSILTNLMCVANIVLLLRVFLLKPCYHSVVCTLVHHYWNDLSHKTEWLQ